MAHDPLTLNDLKRLCGGRSPGLRVVLNDGSPVIGGYFAKDPTDMNNQRKRLVLTVGPRPVESA